MTVREYWVAVGYRALVSFLRFIALFLAMNQSLFAITDKASSRIVADIIQALSNIQQSPQDFLKSKSNLYFPNLQESHVNDAFYEKCEKFVQESSQERVFFLKSVPQDEALNTARPSVRLLEGRVAYIYLPAPHLQSTQKSAYIRFIRKIIRRLERRSPKGWIIDLRDCSGHDPKTLLAGCVDLFQEGPLGFIEQQGPVIESFSKVQNKLFFKNEYLSGGGRLPVRVFNSPRKIAVLQSKETKVAGEVLVLAFKSQKVTKSFGEETAGDLTYYKPYFLQTGGCLLAREGRFLNLTGDYFISGLTPDIPIPDFSRDIDACLNKALEWILGEDEEF